MMGFLRVVEIFPPLFPSSRRKESHINLERGIERFVDQARSVSRFADILLLADVKNPNLLKLSTIEAAAILMERACLNAAPVIVVRDLNRRRFLSAVLTVLSIELRHLMIAWGDDYPARSGATNVRDYESLAQCIEEAALLRTRSAASTKFLAPVNVELLSSKGELARARGRIRAGAEYLLAQPPTTDSTVLKRHSRLLRDSGLEERVILNVFPFRGPKDVQECEKYFGWRLPASLHRIAENGEEELLRAEKEVIEGLRSGGAPGVYFNTRGIPGIAERLLA